MPIPALAGVLLPRTSGRVMLRAIWSFAVAMVRSSCRPAGAGVGGAPSAGVLADAELGSGPGPRPA